MEDPYSHLSVLALALSLSSLWSLTLQGPPPPTPVLLQLRRAMSPPPSATGLGFISTVDRLHWTFQAWWQFGCQFLGRSRLIFDDITKSTCSLFIPDRIKKAESSPGHSPKEVGDSWSGSHSGLVRVAWARSWQAWVLVLAWKPVSCWLGCFFWRN